MKHFVLNYLAFVLKTEIMRSPATPDHQDESHNFRTGKKEGLVRNVTSPTVRLRCPSPRRKKISNKLLFKWSNRARCSEAATAFETMATPIKSPTQKNMSPDSEVESHNFEPHHSEVWRIHERKRRQVEFIDPQSGRQRAFIRWMLTALLAILSEILCVVIIACTVELQALKFDTTLKIASHRKWYTSVAAFFLFLTFSLLFAVVAGVVTLLQPAVGGSGMAEVKSYLNGVNLPHVMHFNTLYGKAVGVIFAQASGLPLGFEGPIVSCCAILGSLFSQGKIWGLERRLSFEDFRNDKERRDFVACATAGGVAAAFGAPIGGVFFALEEGASFMTLKLTWRCFFCAIGTALTGYLLLSVLPPEFVNQLSFLDPFPNSGPLYEQKDLSIFAVMGVLGGLLGAAFNQMNRRLTVFRLAHVTTPRKKMLELMSLTTLMAVLSFGLPFAGRCRSRPQLDTTTGIYSYASTLRPFLCAGDDSYNELASLYLQSWDDSLRILFHLPMHLQSGEPVFSTAALLCFFCPYFFMAFMTFGASVPFGLFIPSLLSGAALGRVVGQALHPLGGFAEPGVYALVMASAVLGGMCRMTISLALILLEATGNMNLLLPLSISLFLSRWVGNAFNESIYHMHIHLRKIPFLEPQCPQEARVSDLRVCEIMATEPLCLHPVDQVGRIYELLAATAHHCFPLREDDCTVFGTISRDILCSLLFLKAFSGEKSESVLRDTSAAVVTPVLPYEKVEQFFPHFPSIATICLTESEKFSWIDLRPYCDTAPYLVTESTAVPRAYRLFRNLGLRHLLVISRNGHLSGILTRHDLEEEHLMASLAHSPMLLSRKVWKITKDALMRQEDGELDSYHSHESPSVSPSMP
ncbi:chloride channel 7 [Nannochloropsis gaditana]|uniref:Chloride channel protein n=2 Tax=Nannochloropsis gaditana TaxID=72520 RepID=W7TB23_9STRA|nr:chloride channel 7 [Nannochloropsis gaditana]